MANKRLSQAPLTALLAIGLMLVLLTSSAGAATRCTEADCSVSAALPPSGEGEESGVEVEEEIEEGEGAGEGPGVVVSEDEGNEEEGEESEAPSKAGRSVVVSDLRLTGKATAALKHRGPSVSSIGFSFVLSAPTKVRVTLLKQTISHGHSRWTAVPGSIIVNAGKGSAHHSLTSHAKLSSGRYMLMAKPTTGRSRSIYLSAHG